MSEDCCLDYLLNLLVTLANRKLLPRSSSVTNRCAYPFTKWGANTEGGAASVLLAGGAAVPPPILGVACDTSTLETLEAATFFLVVVAPVVFISAINFFVPGGFLRRAVGEVSVLAGWYAALEDAWATRKLCGNLHCIKKNSICARVYQIVIVYKITASMIHSRTLGRSAKSPELTVKLKLKSNLLVFSRITNDVGSVRCRLFSGISNSTK